MRQLLLPAVCSAAVWFGAILPASSFDGDPPRSELPASIGYQKFKHGRTYYHMVRADLDSPDLAVETVHTNNLQGVWKLIAKRQPIAAITGTFFAPGQQKPIADVLVDGKLKCSGSRGTALGVGWDGGVRIFDQAYGQRTDWIKYQFGLRGTIRLVKNGVVSPNPKSQKFSDRRLWGRAARTGVGLTRSGKILFVATRSPVTLSELGKAMKAKGVTDAISLDGGTSTCLYYNGQMMISPGRRLCNLVVIGWKTGGGSSPKAPVRLGSVRLR